MKEFFEEAKLELMNFTAEDVLTASNDLGDLEDPLE